MEESVTKLLDDRILIVKPRDPNWIRVWCSQKFFNWNDAQDWLGINYGVTSVNRDSNGGFVMLFPDRDSRIAFELAWDF